LWQTSAQLMQALPQRQPFVQFGPLLDGGLHVWLGFDVSVGEEQATPPSLQTGYSPLSHDVRGVKHTPSSLAVGLKTSPAAQSNCPRGRIVELADANAAAAPQATNSTLANRTSRSSHRPAALASPARGDHR
jgi:hypothetical protein